jgi:hypothetical protein
MKRKGNQMKGKGIFTVFALCLMAGTAQAAVVYKWTTPDGKSHIGDVIPTESLKYGYEVIDQSTWQVEKVPPEETIKANINGQKESDKNEQEKTESIKQQLAATEALDKKIQEERRQKHIAEVKRKIETLKGKIEKLTQGSYSGEEVRQRMMVYQKYMNRLQQDLLNSEQVADSVPTE